MKNWESIILLITLIEWLVSCVPRRKKSETTKTFSRTGEAIALNELIQKYERVHQKFYEKQTKDGDHLQWPALDNKNLSDYCKKYLQHSIPTRTTDYATGIKVINTVHYENNTSITYFVVMVHCKLSRIKPSFSYYITRAPEPNCVYALKCTGTKAQYIYSIINKHCDFEGKPLKHKSLKQNRTEVIGTVHRPTGQPITTDEYFLKFELEHEDMVKRQQTEGNGMEWPYAMKHPNLNLYCDQYIQECAPARNREGVMANWRIEKLLYRKIHTKMEINVTTVTCMTPNASKRQYHMTRAPETNCVYALLRNGNSPLNPLVIIFKHCDFEDLNEQKTILQDGDIHTRNATPKIEMKEEVTNTVETLQLFPEL